MNTWVVPPPLTLKLDIDEASIVMDFDDVNGLLTVMSELTDRVNTIVSPFWAVSMACRKVPAPLSAGLYTTTVAAEAGQISNRCTTNARLAANISAAMR